MSCLIRILAIAGFALLTTVRSPALGEGDDWAVRADRETRTILRAWIAGEVKAVEPCTFSDRWIENRPIDSESAREYLGLNLHADVMAPFDGQSPVEILGPEEAAARNFCSEPIFEEQRKRVFDDFISGKVEGETGRSPSERQMRKRRIELGRPVFDGNFQTAAFVATFTFYKAMKNPDDQKVHPQYYIANGLSIGSGVSGGGVLFIYRRLDGSWIEIGQKQLFILN